MAINGIVSSEIFTDDSLNIFTDASIRRLNSGETIGCAGMIAVYGSSRKQYDRVSIIRNTTNNNSEIKAIRLGVEEAIKNKNCFKTIRLFSDSQISIFGIRDRIFKWYNCDGVLMGYEGNPIKNQDIMLEIVHMITDSNLNIEFYHQQGHVKYDKDSLLNAIHVFSASNNIRDTVSYELIRTLSEYNNYVDIKTKNVLKSLDENMLSENMNMFINALYFNYSNFDKKQYRELTKNKL